MKFAEAKKELAEALAFSAGQGPTYAVMVGSQDVVGTAVEALALCEKLEGVATDANEPNWVAGACEAALLALRVSGNPDLELMQRLTVARDSARNFPVSNLNPTKEK